MKKKKQISHSLNDLVDKLSGVLTHKREDDDLITLTDKIIFIAEPFIQLESEI